MKLRVNSYAFKIRFSRYMPVCVYKYTYIPTIYICSYTHIKIHLHTRQMNIYVNICVLIYKHTYMHVCIYIHTYNIYTYISYTRMFKIQCKCHEDMVGSPEL